MSNDTRLTHDLGTRRHRQDRPPGRRAARGARPAGPHRLPLAAPRRSTGTTATTWAGALEGVGAAYIAYYPDLAFPGAADTIGAVRRRRRRRRRPATGAALRPRRGGGPGRASRPCATAGADWTILRASWFAQNFSEHFLLEAVLDGVIALPAGDVAEPFVDVDDIADVAVAALTDDGHAGAGLRAHRPAAADVRRRRRRARHATGREIRYLPVSRPRSTAPLRPSSTACRPRRSQALTELFTRVLDGRNAQLTDGVRRALGRPPRDFADYARDAAATGVWDVPAGEVVR